MTPSLPAALEKTPRLDRWIRFERPGSVTVYSGKAEIGQGIRTAVAQIAAEELDVDVNRVRVILADTERTPDEGYTAGSNSVEGSGAAIRQAAAAVRTALLARAAARWDAIPMTLRVEDGLIIDPVSENQITYWDLLEGAQIEDEADGSAIPKSPHLYTIVGQPVPRFELPPKVRGLPLFVADIELPGMVHGRIVRPQRPGAGLLSVDGARVAQLPGVLGVVRDGNFLAVVAEWEEVAERAADALRQRARWSQVAPLPGEDEVFEHLRTGPGQALRVIDGLPVPGPIPPSQPLESARRTLRSTYYRPFTMHGSLGPSAAVAQMIDGRLTVWTHSQGVFPLRGALAQVLKMAESEIHLIHLEGPGCYGHNGADDVVLDAALLARAIPGRPILVQWSRGDEHRYEPYGPAMIVELEASLDGGRVVDWNHAVFSYTHSGRPRPNSEGTTLLAASEIEDGLPVPEPRPGISYHGGIHRNADPLYRFPRRSIVKHFVENSPLRTSSLRSLGAFANAFAIESFMDELALAANLDPLFFRLDHLDDARAQGVLERVARVAGWDRELDQPEGGLRRGRGIGFAQYKNQKCYAAVVAELTANPETGVIELERLVIAADAGCIINPDGLSSQLEGGAVQGASWTLKEAVRLGPEGPAADWEGYPVLRFDEAPRVEVHLLGKPSDPPVGAGEATQGPTAAAIANALDDALGIRVRRLPLTPDRVREAVGGE